MDSRAFAEPLGCSFAAFKIFIVSYQQHRLFMAFMRKQCLKCVEFKHGKCKKEKQNATICLVEKNVYLFYSTAKLCEQHWLLCFYNYNSNEDECWLISAKFVLAYRKPSRKRMKLINTPYGVELSSERKRSRCLVLFYIFNYLACTLKYQRKPVPSALCIELILLFSEIWAVTIFFTLQSLFNKFWFTPSHQILEYSITNN